MARVNGQRMGRGVRGCMNMAEWNHLFTPNSDSANEARRNCVDYWMNVGRDPKMPKPFKSESGEVRYESGMLSPKNVLAVLGILVAIYFLMRK